MTGTHHPTVETQLRVSYPLQMPGFPRDQIIIMLKIIIMTTVMIMMANTYIAYTMCQASF